MKNTKNKKIIIALSSAAFIFAAAGSALAFSSDTLAYGHGGYGQGCRGDATCRAERQMQRGGQEDHEYGRMQGEQRGRGYGRIMQGEKRGQEHKRGMRGEHGRGYEQGMRGQRGKEREAHRAQELEALKNSPLLPITEKDKETLTFMHEEEKLARDVYLTLYQKWGANVFSKIADSEQRHIEATKVLLDKYGLEDPVKDDTVGVFTNPELKKMYNELVQRGGASLVEALKVGAYIEDLDIRDLENAIAATDNDDVKKVYSRLRNASENHMRAFYRELKANGADYKAQFISQERLEQVLSGENKNKLEHQREMKGEYDREGYKGHNAHKQENAEMGFFAKLLSWLKFWTW